MPLSKNGRWTYTVQLGFRSSVAEVRTAGRVPVGNQSGWRLIGSQGTTSLAWSGSTLLASELASSQYNPPIVLLDPRLRGEGKRTWRGQIITAGKSQDAEATLTQSIEKRGIGGRSWRTIRTQHEIKFSGRTLELITWFAPDLGILRQEQRLDDKLTHSLEWLSGP